MSIILVKNFQKKIIPVQTQKAGGKYQDCGGVIQGRLKNLP